MTVGLLLAGNGNTFPFPLPVTKDDKRNGNTFPFPLPVSKDEETETHFHFHVHLSQKQKRVSVSAVRQSVCGQQCQK